MQIEDVHYQTFKSGSKTYFNSSRFFPPEVRRDVFYLYGFVRKADNFVDDIPQDPDGFYRFRDAYHRALNESASAGAGDPIIDRFVELHRRKGFDPAWTEAFLTSMEKDLFKQEYNSLEETLEYIYGSAEVIGLFMAGIMELPEESHEPARMLGRAMQYINFIRDIKEDIELGRRYLPLSDTYLSSLEYDYVKNHLAEFRAFHTKQIGLYMGWQREAEKGYRYIPYRFLLPIKTAADMYIWTAKQIEKNPMVVYSRKVKPPKPRIVLQFLYNIGAAPIAAARAR